MAPPPELPLDQDKNFRLTVEIPRQLHRALRVWALDHDLDASAVVRALLAELGESPDLGRQVAARAARTPRRR